MTRGRLPTLAGLALAGQGFLVVTRVLDHELPLPVGWALLAAGLALVAWSLLGDGRGSGSGRRGGGGRGWLVATLGGVVCALVLAWNAARASDLSPPEVALVAYGALLVLSSPFLHRPRVAKAVGYSFALALGPLAAWAVEAALAGTGRAPSAALQWLLVEPMAFALRVGGLDAATLGETIRLATPRGALFLTVGMVCSGLYATVLFMGVFALFAWEARTPPRRLAAYLALGVAGLYVANLVRLVLLGYVGWRWGGAALQSFHAHAGWVLFLAWGIAFWWLVLRRFEGDQPRLRQA